MAQPKPAGIIIAIGQEPPPPSIKLVALLLVGGAGLGLIAVGVTTAWGWTLCVPGLIALLLSLPGLWVTQQRRDKTLPLAACRIDRSKARNPAVVPALLHGRPRDTASRESCLGSRRSYRSSPAGHPRRWAGCRACVKRELSGELGSRETKTLALSRAAGTPPSATSLPRSSRKDLAVVRACGRGLSTAADGLGTAVPGGRRPASGAPKTTQ